MAKRKQYIVCASIRQNGIIICGARHFDTLMHNTIRSLDSSIKLRVNKWEQGFIDQFGKYLSREEAFKIAKENGQEIDMDRNSHNYKLYSEGLY